MEYNDNTRKALGIVGALAVFANLWSDMPGAQERVYK
jgi:hypothetical protein